MSSAKAESLAVDEARRIICHQFARMLNAGSFTVRVRVAHNGDSAGVLFYSHSDEGWQKESDALTERTLVLAVEETLEMLASKKHADEWSARQQASADHRDIDVQFHREKLEHHLGARLESTLAGLLFGDLHDSKKDKRRGIRTPRGGKGRP
jgi:hypothetical protein